jgi:hypothetical protein
MANRDKAKTEPEAGKQPNRPVMMDAIRHVGPTLEAEGTFLPSGELPENVIEREGLIENGTTGPAEDEYDREADAMGAERLHTRLPGDTSSDPHTDTVAENPTTMDDDRKARKKGRNAA